MKKLLFSIALFFISASSYAQPLTELRTAAEFNSLVTSAAAPVVVAFSASWCAPCKRLKPNLVAVAAMYETDQVVMAVVDADKNSSLRKYLLGGYPTVRTFRGGAVASENFVGYQTATSIKRFVENVVGLRFKVGELCPIR